MTQITFTLERAIGGAVLALMLALAVLTLGTPTRATANAPIIVMEQRSPQRVSMPPPEQPPPAAAEPTPALVMPLAIQPEPTAEPPTPVVVVAVESPPPAAPAPVVESKLVYESDGSVTLPGVDDWYTPPAPTAASVVSSPPTGNYCPRCGWRPPRRAP